MTLFSVRIVAGLKTGARGPLDFARGGLRTRAYIALLRVEKHADEGVRAYTVLAILRRGMPRLYVQDFKVLTARSQEQLFCI